MLIKKQDLDGIATGQISLAFRRWKRPTVRAGGTLRTRIGVLAIDSVAGVSEPEITDADARKAGHNTRDLLIDQLRSRTEGQIYRIELRLVGPDPREQLRQDTDLSSTDAEEIDRRLARFDSRSSRGPWTQKLLELVFTHPGTRAADLAGLAGYEKDWLKTNVRKLKELGLTESLETGYRLSPRGVEYWRRFRE